MVSVGMHRRLAALAERRKPGEVHDNRGAVDGDDRPGHNGLAAQRGERQLTPSSQRLQRVLPAVGNLPGP